MQTFHAVSTIIANLGVASLSPSVEGDIHIKDFIALIVLLRRKKYSLGLLVLSQVLQLVLVMECALYSIRGGNITSIRNMVSYII